MVPVYTSIMKDTEINNEPLMRTFWRWNTGFEAARNFENKRLQDQIKANISTLRDAVGIMTHDATKPYAFSERLVPGMDGALSPVYHLRAYISTDLDELIPSESATHLTPITNIIIFEIGTEISISDKNGKKIFPFMNRGPIIMNRASLNAVNSITSAFTRHL